MGWIILIAALLVAYYLTDQLDKQDKGKRQHEYRAGGKK